MTLVCYRRLYCLTIPVLTSIFPRCLCRPLFLEAVYICPPCNQKTRLQSVSEYIWSYAHSTFNYPAFPPFSFCFISFRGGGLLTGSGSQPVPIQVLAKVCLVNRTYYYRTLSLYILHPSTQRAYEVVDFREQMCMSTLRATVDFMRCCTCDLRGMSNVIWRFYLGVMGGRLSMLSSARSVMSQTSGNVVVVVECV